MTKLSTWKMASTILLLCAATAIASRAQTFTKIADLGDALGSNPDSMFFVQGEDGNLYGTNSDVIGGSGGTIFKITPSGTATVLYTFCSQPNCADGSIPGSGVMLATDGNFYGITYEGGTAGEGTVFKITPSGTFTTLHSFCVQPECPDGRLPWGGLMEATDGNLYGTTQAGGGGFAGTIFRISPSGAFTTFYNFSGYDGDVPDAALVEGLDGDLYGTTQRAEPNYYGSVFKITLSGILTNLVTFQGGADAWPSAPLVRDGNRTFYGTATGGTSPDGTIFSITPQGTLTNLYVFCQKQGCPDGGAPIGITSGTDGNLYGITAVGGNSPVCSFDCGTIFQFTAKKKLTTLHDFCEETGCTDGQWPQSGLFQATNGKFYGTTLIGGAYGGGTVYTLDMGLGPFVSFVLPAGRVGQTGGILGQGFAGTTSVSLNGIAANFTVVSDTFIKATVPAGATTGYVTVATPSGTLTSNVTFRVIP